MQHFGSDYLLRYVAPPAMGFADGTGELACSAPGMVSTDVRGMKQLRPDRVRGGMVAEEECFGLV